MVMEPGSNYIFNSIMSGWQRGGRERHSIYNIASPHLGKTSHESDIASDFDPKETVETAADEEDIETIELVLDDRLGTG